MTAANAVNYPFYGLLVSLIALNRLELTYRTDRQDSDIFIDVGVSIIGFSACEKKQQEQGKCIIPLLQIFVLLLYSVPSGKVFHFNKTSFQMVKD